MVGPSFVRRSPRCSASSRPLTAWPALGAINSPRSVTRCASQTVRRDFILPDDATALAAFSYELGVLKRMRRSGWWHAGVRDPESVAEHTMRAAQLAALIAAEERADPARAAFLALWHDTQET